MTQLRTQRLLCLSIWPRCIASISVQTVHMDKCLYKHRLIQNYDETQQYSTGTRTPAITTSCCQLANHNITAPCV